MENSHLQNRLVFSKVYFSLNSIKNYLDPLSANCEMIWPGFPTHDTPCGSRQTRRDSSRHEDRWLEWNLYRVASHCWIHGLASWGLQERGEGAVWGEGRVRRWGEEEDEEHVSRSFIPYEDLAARPSLPRAAVAPSAAPFVLTRC